MPVSAGTLYPFIRGYPDLMGSESTQHFMLDPESRNGYQYEPEPYWDRPVNWFEVGTSTVILDGKDTTLFIASFDAETKVAVVPWEEPDGLNRGTCRLVVG